MASLLLGTAVMASQLRPLPSALSFSKSLSGGVSLSVAPTTSSLSASAPSPNLPLIYCGRGDKKTARGKRFKHSFGNSRPRNKNKGRGPPKSPCPPSAPKKDPYDDGEVVKIEIDEE